jgi:hypothetical protein
MTIGTDLRTAFSKTARGRQVVRDSAQMVGILLHLCTMAGGPRRTPTICKAVDGGREAGRRKARGETIPGRLQHQSAGAPKRLTLRLRATG